MTASASTARPMAIDTNWRWRAWRFCSRCGSRLIRTMALVEASQCEAAGDQQQRRVGGELSRTDAVRHRHVGERIGDDSVDAGTLGDQLVQARYQRAAAGEYDLVDLVVRSRGEEELEGAGDLERQRFHERLQHIGVIILRQ